MTQIHPDVRAVKRLRRLRRDAEGFPSVQAAIAQALAEAEAVMYEAARLREKAGNRARWLRAKARAERRELQALPVWQVKPEAVAVLDEWLERQRAAGRGAGNRDQQVAEDLGRPVVLL